MVLAIAATAVLILAKPIGGDGISATAWAIILVGAAIGGGVGLYTARTVKMTAMPQLVSLFNAMGGGAAALIAIDDYLRRRRRRRCRSTWRLSSTSSSGASPSRDHSSRPAS